MKAIVIYTSKDGEKEFETDVPLAPVEDPSKYEQESLYPSAIHLHGLCSDCDIIHLAFCERVGFRLHDDGQIAVYRLIGVIG